MHKELWIEINFSHTYFIRQPLLSCFMKTSKIKSCQINFPFWLQSKVDQILGHAKFTKDKCVEVNDKKYLASHILIATGGHPVVPTLPGKRSKYFQLQFSLIQIFLDTFTTFKMSYFALQFLSFFIRCKKIVVLLSLFIYCHISILVVLEIKNYKLISKNQ